MEISISEAARTLKISRNTIKKRIAEGELSKTSSGKIETSELFRVFGSSPRPPARPTERSPLTTVLDHQDQGIKEHPLYQAQLDKVRMLEESLRQAQERIDEAKDREQWHKEKIDTLLDTVKLLEAPRQPAPPTQPTQKERLKGFIERVLGR
jgi:excisionase family DNA binding protein